MCLRCWSYTIYTLNPWIHNVYLVHCARTQDNVQPIKIDPSRTQHPETKITWFPSFQPEPALSPATTGSLDRHDYGSEAPEQRDVGIETAHVGVITDPDCLGPCEPGTSVVLEGIVWNETENGERRFINL